MKVPLWVNYALFRVYCVLQYVLLKMSFCDTVSVSYPNSLQLSALDMLIYCRSSDPQHLRHFYWCVEFIYHFMSVLDVFIYI
jgi:hypothetical protein